MYKICFFAPIESAEHVKQAMFKAGAGKIGNYEHCSFESLGTGQFRALAAANPFIGEVGKLEKVSELKIEMVCEESIIKNVIAALKASHPYEVPAYDVVKLADF